jgi:predicted RNase H-like HicB family nuclease
VSKVLILEVKESQHGLWFVTSPHPRGLLVVGDTMQDALAKVVGALNELEQATLSLRQGQ